MENMNLDKEFSYTYSAKEQEEIKRIRQKYQPVEEDDCESGINKLRRMDARVSKKAMVVALVMGIIGALVMGTGMSLIITEFGLILGITGGVKMALGVILGLIGIVLMATAYPVYNKVLKKEREKVAPEIIKLTKELIK